MEEKNNNQNDKKKNIQLNSKDDLEFKNERFLTSDLIKQINLNEDDTHENINFNINPFNDFIQYEEVERLTDNNSNNSDDDDLIFVEKNINNNTNPEKIDLDEYLKKQSEINNRENFKNYFSNPSNNKIEGEKNIYCQMENNLKISNKPITRVPSDPLPISYFGNIGLIDNFNSSFNFYQNQNSNSYGNLNYGNFNLPNNSFSMNGKSGWICPHCKNFNYESNLYYFIIFYSENSM